MKKVRKQLDGVDLIARFVGNAIETFGSFIENKKIQDFGYKFIRWVATRHKKDIVGNIRGWHLPLSKTKKYIDYDVE